MNSKSFQEKYYVDRHDTNCYKWDSDKAKNKLPMWIADTDFKTPQKIIDSLKLKLEEGSYGYGFLPKDYYDVMISWNKKISNVEYKKEWIRFSKGAIDGICQIINSLTHEKDSILICEPVYNPFREIIKVSKRKLVVSNLINNNYHFEMDFKDIENKIVKNNVKMLILCSPHNPVSRVWNKAELEKLFAITHKYSVIVVSDEVHSELIMPGFHFIPSLSFKKYQNDIITINAESKTFSLALFNHCHIVIPNKKFRKEIDEYQNAHHIASPNAFNGLSSYYAYKYGEDWLDGFKKTVYENYLYLKKSLKDYCDLNDLEGTYLAFADFSKSIKEGNAANKLYESANVYLNAGDMYGKGYENWVRFNLATSLDNVKKACRRIKKALS